MRRCQDVATGVRYRHHEFRHDGWSKSGEQVSLIARGPLVAGVRAWQAEGGLRTEGGHTLLTMDGSTVLPISQGTSAEFVINRDFVETRAALYQGINFTSVGGSLEHQLHPKVTLIGTAGYQRFSDDSERKHARFRAVFQPDLDLGLTFQYRYRYDNSTPNETRRAYFNPERYQEHAAGRMALSQQRPDHQRAGWRRQPDHRGYAEGPSRLLEVGGDRPLKGRQVLALRAGYLRTAAFGGPD